MSHSQHHHWPEKPVLAALGVCFLLLFNSTSRDIAASIKATSIYPHEEAYRQAPYVLLARVVSFDTTKGALIAVVNAVRGDVASGSHLYLQGTSRLPYLNAPGANLTVFLQSIDGGTAILWQGATTGGIIWGNHGTLNLIAAAHAHPEKSLDAAHPRERLAAAYYLATQRNVNEANTGQVMKSLIWGLEQEEPEINQAALDALGALGIDLEGIAGPYHPGFRPKLKRAVAEKLSVWWEKRHQP